METFFQDGDEQINGDGRPDLRAQGVGACGVEGFDAPMLFDRLEEQFDLPATVIQLRDGPGRHGEIMGQKDQCFSGFEMAIANAPQRGGIILLGLQAGRDDRLVKAQAGGFVHRVGVAADEAEVFLGASDQERGTLMQAMPAGEVQITAIHDVERTGLPNELVEEVYVVNAPRRDHNDGGKVAVEREQRVEFEGGLVLAELGPWEQREAQVHGGGVQGVSRGFEIGKERVFGVKRGGLDDADMSEVGEESPVALRIGIGQRAACGGLAETGVIKFRAERGQTGFEVAETFAPGQWSESEHEEVFVGGQFANQKVAVVTGDTLVKIVFGQEVQKLGEDGATFVHKLENRRNAGNHPRRTVAELKSKKTGTVKSAPYYADNLAVTQKRGNVPGVVENAVGGLAAEPTSSAVNEPKNQTDRKSTRLNSSHW